MHYRKPVTDLQVTIYHALGGHSDTERLLRAAAGRWLGLDPAGLAMARTEAGKPFFPGWPGLHASVTHSGGRWLCALGESPLGLDLERTRPIDGARLARRFFHPEEAAWLEARPGDFFRLWTAKEALVKRAGTGLAGHMRDLSLVENGALTLRPGGLYLTYPPFEEGFTLCLCTEAPPALTWAALEAE